VVVVVIGALAGLGFVALLVGPLRRLRVGVERLAAGDVTVRVPPTSRDEVGELTRAFNEMGDSLEQKHKIQQAFGRYVDDYVLNQLLESDTHEKQVGIEREVTILFVDIRQFTRLSEGMNANDVVLLLNECFQLISDLILGAGGTIDKFIGDSVMAYFGAPLPQADHALRAVTAAIEIARAVERRNAQIAAADDGRVPISIGVGIHTGVVVVGNIGSDRRTDFTAVGDAVNVAHRLEKLARPGEILVSEAVQRQARGAARLRFEGERQLSGREEPVHVYSVELGRSARGCGGRGGAAMTGARIRAPRQRCRVRRARLAAAPRPARAASCSTAQATCAARSRRGAPPIRTGIAPRIAAVEQELEARVQRYIANAQALEREGRIAEALLDYRLAFELRPDDAANLAHIQQLARDAVTQRTALLDAYRDVRSARRLRRRRARAREAAPARSVRARLSERGAAPARGDRRGAARAARARARGAGWRRSSRWSRRGARRSATSSSRPRSSCGGARC
jgi:class 3 adenylate cyclase